MSDGRETSSHDASTRACDRDETKNSLLLINRTASYYDSSSAFGLSQAEAEYSGGIPQVSKFGPFGDLLDGNVTLVATRTLMRKGRASRATKTADRSGCC